MSHYWKILYHESFFIPEPTLTEKNCPDQSSRVSIITGGNTGVGYQLCKILYAHNGTVYLTSRNIEKGNTAIQKIKEAHPDSKGRLELLQLDLGDLTTIKKSAEEFQRKEKKLHFLCNNAGVMMPPAGSKTTQDHELQIGTNCIAPWLFSYMLKATLVETAKTAPPNSVRVAWAGSAAIDLFSPAKIMDEQGGVIVQKTPSSNYGVSKVGNRYLAKGFADETKGSGVVSVCFNPGNLHTELNRHTGASEFLQSYLLYPAIKGAYTELYCGLSPDITTADNGCYVAPWGVKRINRPDVEKAMTDGTADKFVAYCRKETKKYL